MYPTTLMETSTTQSTSDCTNSVGVPNNQGSIDTRSADLRDLPIHRLIWPHARNRILVDSRELRIRLACASNRRLPTNVGIAEGGKSTRLETTRGARSETRARSTSRLGIIESTSFLPSLFGTREDYRAAIVSGSYNSIFRRPGQRNKG